MKNQKKNIYTKVVIAAILVILVNQCLIQYVLHKKEKDAQVINIAGRQRMYSQRVLNLYQVKDQGKLDVVLSKWNQSHQQLINDFSEDFYFFNTDSIKNKLISLNPYIDYATKVIKGEDNVDHSQLHNNQEAYLYEMNSTVEMIEKNSTKKLHLIIIFELLFACLSLGLIYYEVNKIFKPIINDLSESNSLLEESNILLKKYAYLASHNFKSPIRTIVSYIGLFKKKYFHQMSGNDKLYHSYIETATTQLTKASDDLVLYSEIYSRSVKLDSVNVMDLYESIINEKKQENSDINFEIIADPKNIKADISLLKIAINRIINNSIYFRNKEGALNVKLKHTSDGTSDILIVEDNGIGIDDTYQEKAFEIFEKLHNSSAHTGNGIGLAICKNIIDKHKGKIKMKACHSSGTKTIIELPI